MSHLSCVSSNEWVIYHMNESCLTCLSCNEWVIYHLTTWLIGITHCYLRHALCGTYQWHESWHDSLLSQTCLIAICHTHVCRTHVCHTHVCQRHCYLPRKASTPATSWQVCITRHLFVGQICQLHTTVEYTCHIMPHDDEPWLIFQMHAVNMSHVMRQTSGI